MKKTAKSWSSINRKVHSMTCCMDASLMISWCLWTSLHLTLWRQSLTLHGHNFQRAISKAIPLVLATRSMTPSAGSALLLETVRKVIDSIEKSWPLQVTLHGSLASCQDVSHHHLLVDGCTQFKRDFLFSVQRSLIIMFRESFFHRFKSARTNTFNTAEKNDKCEGPKSNYFQYHEG